MNALGSKARSVVEPLRFQGDDAQLVAAVRRGHLGACTVLYDRYVQHVQRVITRIMGVDPELEDLTNTVFCEAIKSVQKLSHPERLKVWITQIAVFTARRCIRSRKRKKWLKLWPDEKLTSLPLIYEMDVESLELARLVRTVMEKMNTDEHVCFSLRYLSSMEIKDIAESCGFSIRTAKRKLARSEKRFKKLAMAYPALAERLNANQKWRRR